MNSNHGSSDECNHFYLMLIMTLALQSELQNLQLPLIPTHIFNQELIDIILYAVQAPIGKLVISLIVYTNIMPYKLSIKCR